MYLHQDRGALEEVALLRGLVITSCPVNTPPLSEQRKFTNGTFHIADAINILNTMCLRPYACHTDMLGKSVRTLTSGVT